MALTLLLAGCGGGGSGGGEGIAVDGAWARAMPEGANSAVYFTLRNRSSSPDRLVGGVTEVAGAVEIHESRLEGDVMKMEEVSRIEVPARGEVELRPGGFHVMLLELERSLIAGDSLTLFLHFEEHEPLTLRVPVRPPGGA